MDPGLMRVIGTLDNGPWTGQSLFVHKQAEWPLNVPPMEAAFVLPDRPPMAQQLQEHHVSGVEAHQPGPSVRREKAVPWPKTGNKVVQPVRNGASVPSDASAEARAAKHHRTSPPAVDDPTPGSALCSHDATNDFAGLQNPRVVRSVVVTPGPDSVLRSPVHGPPSAVQPTTGDRRPATDGNDAVHDRPARPG